MAKPHPEFGAGVRWAVALLRDWAEAADAEMPSERGRGLTLRDAAAKLLAAQHRRRPKRQPATAQPVPPGHLL